MEDFHSEYKTEENTDNFQVANTQPIEPIKRDRSSARWAWLFVSIIAAALIIAVAVIQAAYLRSAPKVPELPPSRGTTPVSAPSPAELSNSFREITKIIKPAVVYIENTGARRGDDLSEFGLPFPGRRPRESSAGSGFIVTQDGYTLTNNHVVENATHLDVTLADNKKLPARVIGTDKETDLAVIKVESSGLPIAVLGDSDGVQQGDWVLALGAPFGFQQTLTAGIVSATGREFAGSQFSRYIQTDASINPGNSGGPLINIQGEVVGINTMIIAEPRLGGGGGNVGIGFAIASNTAREVFAKLVRDGKVSRGYLGVIVTELDGPKAQAAGLEPGSGVFVDRIPSTDSPAGKAGLRSGDVITSFDGKPVKMPRELTNAVASLPVGKSVRVDFVREGKPESVTVELAERTEEVLNASRNQPAPPDQPQGEMEPGRLGLFAQTVTPEKAQELKLKIASGAVVVFVQPGSPAFEAGLKHGDIIHRFGRAEIKSADDLTAASKAAKEGERVAVQIERNGLLTWITIEIE
ncbi:MAG TPA: trypsin-like peptidase domain-containing protein [Blastocatellia bacterium]|jgi:serine protease Do